LDTKSKKIKETILSITIVVLTFVWLIGGVLGFLGQAIFNSDGDYHDSHIFEKSIYLLINDGYTNTFDYSTIIDDYVIKDEFEHILKQTEKLQNLYDNCPAELKPYLETCLSIADENSHYNANALFDLMYEDYCLNAEITEVFNDQVFQESEEGVTAASSGSNSVKAYLTSISELITEIYSKTSLSAFSQTTDAVRSYYNNYEQINYYQYMHSPFARDNGICMIFINGTTNTFCSNIQADFLDDGEIKHSNDYVVSNVNEDVLKQFDKIAKIVAKDEKYYFEYSEGEQKGKIIDFSSDNPFEDLFKNSFEDSFVGTLDILKNTNSKLIIVQIHDNGTAVGNIKTTHSIIPNNSMLILKLSVAVLAISFILVLILFTSYGKNIDKIPFYEKIPNDIKFIFTAVLVIALPLFLLFAIGEVSYLPDSFIITISLIIGTVLIFGISILLLLSYVLSLIFQIRNKTLIKNNLWYRFFAFLKRLFNMKLNVLHKSVLVFGAIYIIINLVFTFLISATICSNSSWIYFLGALDLIFNTVVLLYFYHIVKSVDKIFDASYKLANGHIDTKIDIESIPKYLRDSAVSINRIGDGMQVAVDKAIREESTKLELITNVSHDLKTPLTSIITYTDLLKMCNIENPTEKEYIDILSEKSQRLKVLIDDLVEASKASTGNIKVEPMQLKLYELVLQTAGENADRLKNNGNEIIANAPDEEIIIYADGKHTARILQNLLSNAAKYSETNTRVYIDICKDQYYGIITIKNISKAPLNLTSEQLMQRFVRGDTARTTEGSGLGLSIVQSLAEIQGGKFSIEIDGDLFKATVKLPLAK
jgi:signal transduction histidine kinase